MNPNDGYDLGLMMASYPLHIHSGCTMDEFQRTEVAGIPGQVLLKNECRAGTIQLSAATATRLGNPKTVKIYLEDDRLLILNS